MLQNIRDNIQGTIAKVIIAIIIIPFAIFGVETLISGSNVVAVAKVNGDKITQPELQQAVNQQKRRLLAMMGDNVQPDMLDESKLRGPVLEGLISQRLLQQSAEDLKLRVPAQAVDQTILSIPSFQEGGKFSVERYQALLRDQGYTPASFKQALQQDMLITQLRNGLTESEFVTSKEFDRVAGLLQQQRSFRYVLIPVAALAGKIEVTDADIKAYYDSHSKDYLRPERVKLRYIDIRAEDFAEPVDEAALRAEYDREMASFKSSTERHAAHIMVAVNKQRDDKQAKELLVAIQKKLAAGEPFDKLAREYSDDAGSKNSGGDLGYSSGDTFPPVFEAALDKLKVGEVSAPVRSSSGYHLIKLLDEQTKSKPTFAEKKDEIAKRLQAQSAQPALLKTVEKLRDLAFNSEDLSGPAKQLKLTVKDSDWVDRDSTDPLLGNAKVIAAAFSDDVLKGGNNSDVIELSPDHYVVVRVKQHEAATPKPLDEVKTVVVAALKQQRATEQGDKLAQEMLAQVRQGQDLQKLAEQHGYTVQAVENSSRNNGGANAELLQAAFAMPKPSAQHLSLETTRLDNGDVALLQLQSVVAGTQDSLNPAQRKALLAQLRRGDGEADFAAYTDDIKARAEIKREE